MYYSLSQNTGSDSVLFLLALLLLRTASHLPFASILLHSMSFCHLYLCAQCWPQQKLHIPRNHFAMSSISAVISSAALHILLKNLFSLFTKFVLCSFPLSSLSLLIVLV